ncbi:MAG: insulinase family protein [Woeseiaceae bacterium]|nr:insulinase family protein [Woeseiaceae bacterium]NIP20642.1 insulinase family protein [Woeseiaceae bacterium]NIS89435.1 insulinase family protein [Woeseiaceae bacterium]
MRLLFALSALFATGLASGQGVTLPGPEFVALENGAVFIVHEKRDVPLVGVTAIVRGGAAVDPDDRAGLASLLASMLQKGAGERDAAAFAETVDAAGATLTSSAGLEAITISGEFLARDAGLAIELLRDMLRSPMLDRAEFTKLRDRQVDLIRASKDNDLRALLSIYGNAWLFTNHPYGTTIGGDETSLGNISHRDLGRYYEDFVGADRLTISVVGDIDAGEIIESLTAAFADWRPASEPLPEIEAAAPQPGRRVLLVDKPGATQTYFWIGNVGVARNFAQRAELDIANTLFGGRFTSLLNNEMRTKNGLTYGVVSSLVRPAQPGSVAIISYTKTDSTVVAIDLAISLLSQMLNEGFSAELVTSGKNYILGQFPPRFETSAQLAGQFASLHAAGLDESYVNDYGAAVAEASGEEILSVIRAVYPRPENLVFVIIGDAELIRDDIAKYGPVTEMSITEPRFTP